MPVGTHYGDTSLKEDVLDIIFQITPEDTPFFNMIGDSSATSPKHEWQVRSLTTRQVNAQVEGDSYTFVEPVLPTRVENLTQIFAKYPRVSNTSQATARHAIDDLMADQMEQRMVEFKTDMEHALLRGSQASGNASAVARQMDGLLNIVSTNTLTLSGGTTLTEDHLNDLLEDIWEQGGKPGDVLVNGFLKRRISTFTASSTKFQQQEARKVINTISVYESDFSVVNVALSRDIPQATDNNTLVALDRSMFGKGWLRTPVSKRVADTADSVDAVIIGEVTLEYGNEAAAGTITDAS